ncbi:MAG TPA: transcriptional regulator [Methanotrichaceae archaeon]|nr:transcriptional regulator [Methanotrichaceae archaeon]HQF15543.1 transcriptional regulator [Methanotrichaceae archaeon]HQI90279.1 transcriptional regulator [Methanotrichaceae archaeon]HQJ27753.1 transcriptional regulator [Methanotrichaceae archaeon]
MDKELLTGSVIKVLQEAGFTVSALCDIRPRSFDLIARRGELLMLMKILSNIDGLNERTAVEMTRLASHLGCQVLMVGEKTRDQWLERGAVYFRYDVPTVSLDTLADHLLEGTPPLVYAAHGGLYVRIDGELLRSLRTNLGISLGDLASRLGVSRRTVSKYESEAMDTSIDVALKLEEIFDRELIQAVNIFRSLARAEKPGLLEDMVLQQLAQIGLDVFPIGQAPFNAVAKDDDMVVLTGISKVSTSMVKKARLMSSLSAVAMTHSAVIVDGEVRVERIEETALIEKRELASLDSSADFADLVIEKRGVEADRERLHASER